MEPTLTHLVAELRRRFASPERVAEVEAYLSSAGYDRGQIGTIISAWLSDIRRREGGIRPAEPWAVRVQGPHERGRFSPEAWGALIGMRSSGRLGGQELEMVIERLLVHVEGRIGIEDVRSALDLGFGTGSSEEPTIVH